MELTRIDFIIVLAVIAAVVVYIFLNCVRAVKIERRNKAERKKFQDELEKHLDELVSVPNRTDDSESAEYLTFKEGGPSVVAVREERCVYEDLGEDEDENHFSEDELERFVCYYFPDAALEEEMSSDTEHRFTLFKEGEPVISLVKEVVHYYSWIGADGLIFKENGLYGILDLDGNIVVPAVYTNIQRGELGDNCVWDWNVETISGPYFFVVWKGDKCGLLSLDGEVILPPVYDEFKRIMPTCVTVIEDGTMYDVTLEKSIATETNCVTEDEKQWYEQIDVFEQESEEPSQQRSSDTETEIDYVPYFDGSLYGVKDATDKAVLPIEYEQEPYEVFHEHFVVKKNGLYGLANVSGEAVIPCEYERFSALLFYSVLFVGKDSLFIINCKGKIVWKGERKNTIIHDWVAEEDFSIHK